MTNAHHIVVSAQAVAAPVDRHATERIRRALMVFVFIVVAAVALVAAISPEVFESGLMTVAQFAYDAAGSITRR